jgi:hypothetical protein
MCHFSKMANKFFPGVFFLPCAISQNGKNHNSTGYQRDVSPPAPK